MEMQHGDVGTYNLCEVSRSGRAYGVSRSYGLRPVFTLKIQIKVTGGDGTSEKPYELGV